MIIGIILMVVGTVVATVAKFKVADITGFAVTMYGAGLVCSSLWIKRDTETPVFMSFVSVVCIGAGGFLLGFAGMAESTMTMIITAVSGVVAVILGILAINLQKKEPKE